MKLKVNGKFKIWTVCIIAVLVLGLGLLGILGFNQTVDFKESYEVVVSMDTQLEVETQKLHDYAEEYLDSKGIVAVDYATETVDGPIGGYSVIYKFDKNVHIDQADMLTFVKNKINIDQVVVTVDYNKVSPYYSVPFGWIALGLGIATVVIFLYLLIVEKCASALSVMLSSLLSIVGYIAMLGIVRLPSQPFAPTMAVFAFALATFLSTGLVNRFKEEVRLNNSVTQSTDRLTFGQIADKVANASKLRFAFVFVALALISVLMVIIGATYVKFLGLHILVASLCGVFSSLIGVPLIWPQLKKVRNKKA